MTDHQIQTALRRSVPFLDTKSIAIMVKFVFCTFMKLKHLVQLWHGKNVAVRLASSLTVLYFKCFILTVVAVFVLAATLLRNYGVVKRTLCKPIRISCLRTIGTKNIVMKSRQHSITLNPS